MSDKSPWISVKNALPSGDYCGSNYYAMVETENGFRFPVTAYYMEAGRGYSYSLANNIIEFYLEGTSKYCAISKSHWVIMNPANTFYQVPFQVTHWMPIPPLPEGD